MKTLCEHINKQEGYYQTYECKREEGSCREQFRYANKIYCGKELGFGEHWVFKIRENENE